MYHGSPLLVDVLSPRNEHGDPKVDACVFGTPSREFALAYCGRKWGDNEMEQAVWYNRTAHTTDMMVLREMRPGAIDAIYAGRRGYLYHLPVDAFFPLLGRESWWEAVAITDIVPTQVEVIPDVLAALKACPNVHLCPYDPRSRGTVVAVERQVSRMLEMSREDARGYLSWWLHGAPSEMRTLFMRTLEAKKWNAG